MNTAVTITAIICVTLIAMSGILGSVFKKMIEVNGNNILNQTEQERKDDNA